MAAIKQVHRIDRHPHVGRALALDHVELLHRHDRMQPGQLAPALEAGLGPIAIGAADVDRPKLAQDQQHFVEMIGRGVVRVDQQGNVQLGFGVFVSVSHRVLSLCLSAVHTATETERNRRLNAIVPAGAGTSIRRNRVMKRLF